MKTQSSLSRRLVFDMFLFVRLVSILSLLVVLTSISALGQKLPSADAISASGSFNGQLYTNTALGFTMLAPGGWKFYTLEQNKALVAKNRENAAVSGDEALENAAANTQVLFQAMPQREKTALLSCGVERLKTNSTAQKYIGANKELVLRRPGVKVTKDIYAMTFGGVSFSAFEVEGSTSVGIYRQRYIATVRKSAALFFVVTLYDNKQDEIVEHSLRSINFKSRQ